MFPKPKDAKRKRHDVIDGIRYIVDKTSRRVREICVTKAAKERRRCEVFEASRDSNGVARCARCRCRIWLDSFHWHHHVYKGMGGANTDDSLANAEAICGDCHDAEHNKESKREKEN